MEPVQRGLVYYVPGGVVGRSLRDDSLTARRIGGHYRYDRVAGGQGIGNLHIPTPLWVSSTVRGGLQMVERAAAEHREEHVGQKPVARSRRTYGSPGRR
jgi:hypothetical protein